MPVWNSMCYKNTAEYSIFSSIASFFNTLSLSHKKTSRSYPWSANQSVGQLIRNSKLSDFTATKNLEGSVRNRKVLQRVLKFEGKDGCNYPVHIKMVLRSETSNMYISIVPRLSCKVKNESSKFDFTSILFHTIINTNYDPVFIQRCQAL